MSQTLNVLADEEHLDVLMARQPIFSKNQDVVAFELLFRGNNGEAFDAIEDEKATFNVIINAYTNVFDQKTKRQVPCFLKVTDTVLMRDSLPDLPPHLFSFEILGRSNITPAFAEKVREIAAKGYRIVLADYDPDDQRFDLLLNIVHVLKLDIQKLGLDRLPGIIAKLRSHQLELLADKVETKDEFRKCLEMGFSLYQGFFLSRPAPVKGKKIEGNKAVLLQLMAELNNPDATGASLERIAINDPALTYKILRVVNAAAFQVPKEIDSLSHAITLIGLDQIKRWILLFLTTGVEGHPSELTRSMLVRGRMCELLAELSGFQNSMSFFTTGLLSQLDALLSIEMNEVMAQVPLSSEVKNAILHSTGTMGQVLQDVKYYERGLFDDLKLGLEPKFYEVAYRHSFKWADKVLLAMQEK